MFWSSTPGRSRPPSIRQCLQTDLLSDCALQRQRLQQSGGFHSVVQAAQKRASEQGALAAGSAERAGSGTSPVQLPAGAQTGDASGSSAPQGSSAATQPGSSGLQSAHRDLDRAAAADARASQPASSARSAELPPPDEPQEVELSLLPRRSYSSQPQPPDGPGDAACAPVAAVNTAAAGTPQQAPRIAAVRRRSASLPYQHADTGNMLSSARRPCMPALAVCAPLLVMNPAKSMLLTPKAARLAKSQSFGCRCQMSAMVGTKAGGQLGPVRGWQV